MVLKTRSWGTAGLHSVVCVHGVTQHGGVFEGLGERLAAAGHSVMAVDLRGHGDSGHEPPWNTATHVADLLETVDAAGIERISWVGHSFGGRMVAEAAACAGARTDRLALLDPGLSLPPARALRGAEIDRLDWSFATVDGVINALLSSDQMVAPPHDVIADYARDDARKGPDGRFRLSFCPSASVVAWSEMALEPPPIAQLPTLLLLPEVHLSSNEQTVRYQDALGELLTVRTVPHGHNVLWEAPAETIAVLEEFLAPA
jgi:pimeloyl-ACP methyl ester carboxylesterase